MTDLLSKILTKHPPSEMTVSQLKTLLSSLQGQTLGATLQTASSGNGPLQLAIPLPQPRQGGTQSLILIIDNLSVSKRLAPLLAEIQLQVTPTLQNNRVSLPLQVDYSNLTGASLQKPLTALFQQLAQWLEVPKPLIALRQATNTGSQVLLTKAAAPTPATVIAQSANNAPTTAQPKAATTAPATALIPPSQTAVEKTSTAVNKDSTPNTQGLKLPLQLNLGEQIKRAVIDESSPPLKTVERPALDLSPRLPLPSQAQTLKHYLSQFNSTAQPVSDTLGQLRRLIQVLSQLSSQGSASNARQHLTNWLEQLPNAQNLDVKTLQQAIQRSGVFFENKLSQVSQSGWSVLQPPLPVSDGKATTTATPTDTKQLFYLIRHLLTPESMPLPSATSASRPLTADGFSGVQKLVNFARGWLNQNARTRQLTLNSERLTAQAVSQETESALSRIKLNQFQNLHLLDANTWVFELPLQFQKQLSQVQMKFEQNAKADKKSQTQWRVTIRFDFESLGAFHAITTLKGNKLDVRFVAEEVSTAQLLQHKMPELKQQLVDCGLLINDIKSETGSSEPLTLAQLPQSLVDYRI